MVQYQNWEVKEIYEMSRGHLGIAAVVDAEGRLVGCFSDGDLRRLLGGPTRTLGLLPEENLRLFGASGVMA